MAKEQILIIEDEEDILAVIHYNISKEGYRVASRTTGEEGLQAVRELLPDLVVLDLMLPGMDGIEVCRQLRREPATARIPVIMLTAKSEEADVVTGLETGADDYVTKPFSHRILLARIQTALRRREKERQVEAGTAPIEIHELVIHPGRSEVRVAGTPVELTYTEFQVLCLLAGRPGWVFSRTQIVDAVRGEGYAVTDRAVDVQIVGLRKKLGECGRYIETVRGVGYRFKE